MTHRYSIFLSFFFCITAPIHSLYAPTDSGLILISQFLTAGKVVADVCHSVSEVKSEEKKANDEIEMLTRERKVRIEIVKRLISKKDPNYDLIMESLDLL